MKNVTIKTLANSFLLNSNSFVKRKKKKLAKFVHSFKIVLVKFLFLFHNYGVQ